MFRSVVSHFLRCTPRRFKSRNRSRCCSRSPSFNRSNRTHACSTRGHREGTNIAGFYYGITNQDGGERAIFCKSGHRGRSGGGGGGGTGERREGGEEDANCSHETFRAWWGGKVGADDRSRPFVFRRRLGRPSTVGGEEAEAAAEAAEAAEAATGRGGRGGEEEGEGRGAAGDDRNR